MLQLLLPLVAIASTSIEHTFFFSSFPLVVYVWLKCSCFLFHPLFFCPFSFTLWVDSCVLIQKTTSFTSHHCFSPFFISTLCRGSEPQIWETTNLFLVCYCLLMYFLKRNCHTGKFMWWWLQLCIDGGDKVMVKHRNAWMEKNNWYFFEFLAFVVVFVVDG